MPKGVTNNPKGRPPKNRALTEILEKTGAAQLDINGEKVSGKRLLARLLWEGLTTGRVTFRPAQEGQEAEGYALKPEEWLGLAKFIYQQVDGPPKQTLEHSGQVDVTKLTDEELDRRLAVAIARREAPPAD